MRQPCDEVATYPGCTPPSPQCQLGSVPARDPEKDGGGVTVVDAAIIINQSLFVQRQVTTKELLFYTFVRSADVLCFD